MIDSQPFAKKARESYEVLQNMFKHMDSLYTEISEFFSFDKQKYTIEEFFGDIKTFKDDFMVSEEIMKSWTVCFDTFSSSFFFFSSFLLTACSEGNNKTTRGRREAKTSERGTRKSRSGESSTGCTETSTG